MVDLDKIKQDFEKELLEEVQKNTNIVTDVEAEPLARLEARFKNDGIEWAINLLSKYSI